MSTWIEDLMEWRERVASAPKPFVTPPITSSALYLAEEAGELLAAVHKLTRPDDRRNPESLRESIEDELGDVLMMLGTVASQAGFTDLHVLREVRNDKVLSITRRLYGVVGEIVNTVWDGDSATGYFVYQLDYAYSLVRRIATLLLIDPDAVLASTLKKVEAR